MINLKNHYSRKVVSHTEPCIDDALELLEPNGLVSSRGYGVVSVCVNQTRNVLCDYSWDSLDAKVVCQQLGFSEYGLLQGSIVLLYQWITKVHFPSQVPLHLGLSICPVILSAISMPHCVKGMRVICWTVLKRVTHHLITAILQHLLE